MSSHARYWLVRPCDQGYFLSAVITVDLSYWYCAICHHGFKDLNSVNAHAREYMFSSVYRLSRT